MALVPGLRYLQLVGRERPRGAPPLLTSAIMAAASPARNGSMQQREVAHDLNANTAHAEGNGKAKIRIAR